jgi:hypothetical protein
MVHANEELFGNPLKYDAIQSGMQLISTILRQAQSGMFITGH